MPTEHIPILNVDEACHHVGAERTKLIRMSAETREYDLVVMGGGPAGVFAATVATAFRDRVAPVDYRQAGCGFEKSPPHYAK
jgi:hypothetical protein